MILTCDFASRMVLHGTLVCDTWKLWKFLPATFAVLITVLPNMERAEVCRRPTRKENKRAHRINVRRETNTQSRRHITWHTNSATMRQIKATLCNSAFARVVNAYCLRCHALKCDFEALFVVDVVSQSVEDDHRTAGYFEVCIVGEMVPGVSTRV